MKICIVSPSSPLISVGGIERYLETTFRELDKKNIEVHLVTSANGNSGIEKIGNVFYHKLKYIKPNLKDPQNAGKRLYQYIKKLIKKQKIDIICAENFYRGIPPSLTFAVNLASMESNIPIILRMHSNHKGELERALIKDLFWNKILPVSKEVSSRMYETGVNLDNIVTVYPPVDTEKFKPGLGKDWLRSRVDVNKEDNIILHASRICGCLEEKGVLNLIKAFSIIEPHHKNTKLLIAAAKSSPSLQKMFDETCKRIEEFAKLNGVGDKVIIKSFNLEDMPLVYNGADMFVMASRDETFGLAYAEALSCRIPVIGTSIGGIPEIIDERKTGYLVEPDNSVELSKKIKLLLENPKRREKMGREGRKIIEKRFALKKTSDRLTGIFDSILQKKPLSTYTRLTNKIRRKQKNHKNLKKY